MQGRPGFSKNMEVWLPVKLFRYNTIILSQHSIFKTQEGNVSQHHTP